MIRQPAEKQKVIEAIGELGRTVTAADVATKTGLPILTVTQRLNEVASEAGGHLRVAGSGDIAYHFSPGFSNAYLARGIQAFMEKAGRLIFDVGFFLLRISFGVLLIVSFLLIIAIVIAILLRGGSRSSGYGDDHPLPIRISFFDMLLLRDLLAWHAYSRATTVYEYDKPTIRRRPKSNFFFNCFSFLFGDGNPNEGLDEKRWQLIARAIRKNNYVMTSEQLAPYTGADPSDQDAVLPVLVRFNGKPEVTDSGNIVYVFPEMQSASATSYDAGPPAYLSEFKWKFTNAPASDLLPVYVVSGLNFFGAWTLWGMLAGGPSPAFDTLLAVLVIYGTAFVTIPIVRWMVLNVLNRRIEQRNIRRFQFADRVANPTPELAKKLQEASDYKLRTQRITCDDVVYTTEKASLDQEDHLDEAFKELDSKSRTQPADSQAAQPPEKRFSEDEQPVRPSGSESIDTRIKRPSRREFDASP